VTTAALPLSMDWFLALDGRNLVGFCCIAT
jgi:hypothetical protein